jgi:hypothetical protein
MLFDLRGRGRRRTVQVIYIGLALLMGGGLVFLGVGTVGGGGGLLNAASSNEGSSSASFANQVKKYEKLTKAQPGNASAWENLTSALLHEAGSEAYVTSSGTVTAKGKELFSRVASAWDRYIALDSANPNDELAQRMEVVFGEEGVDDPEAEVQVLEIAIVARPTSAALYAELAKYAYQAHNVREGDLASEKALSLAPAAQRPRLKTELAELKKNPTGSETETATSSSGQPYAVKRGANGSILATPSPSTPASGGHPSTKKP